MPGSADAVGRLRAPSVPRAVVTDHRRADDRASRGQARRCGHPGDRRGRPSPQAARRLLSRDEHVLVAGGPGVWEVGRRRRRHRPGAYAEAARAPCRQSIVVGYHRDFDYDRMRIGLARAVRARRPFLATNDDATFPTVDGELPRQRAIVAGIATAAGTAPTIAGKPHRPMVDLLRSRLGDERSRHR